MINIGDNVECVDKYDSYFGATGVVVNIDRVGAVVLTNTGETEVFARTQLKKIKTRGFEKISTIQCDIPIPQRGTSKSAGYDIYVIHPEVYKLVSTRNMSLSEAWELVPKVNGKATVIKPPEKASIVLPTGIKCYMQDNEYLLMTVRSSSGIKLGIRQSNPPSIIDADYYNNADNEGHIMFAIKNNFIEFDEPVLRLCQGVFSKYYIADDDNVTATRLSGIGSTNKC